jgi:hypothetical protein
VETLLIGVISAICIVVAYLVMRGDATQTLGERFERRKLSRADYEELRRLVDSEDRPETPA